MELRRRARFWQPAARAAGTATTSTRHLGRRSGLQEIPAPTQRLPTDAPTKEDCRRGQGIALASCGSKAPPPLARGIRRELMSSTGSVLARRGTRGSGSRGPNARTSEHWKRQGTLEAARHGAGAANATIMTRQVMRTSTHSLLAARRTRGEVCNEASSRATTFGLVGPRALTCDHEGGASGASWLAPKRLPL